MASEEPACGTGHVLPVPMDGNCLFHSAFRELRRLRIGELTDAHHLRMCLMDWIASNGDKAECGGLTLGQWVELETEESLERYVARMRKDGEWGGITELYALTVRRTPCLPRRLASLSLSLCSCGVDVLKRKRPLPKHVPRRRVRSVCGLFRAQEVYDVTTCVWEPLGRTNGGSWRYTRRHALEGSSARQRDSPSGTPELHLHYNGCSHYSVFVPDIRAVAPPQSQPLPRNQEVAADTGTARRAQSQQSPTPAGAPSAAPPPVSAIERVGGTGSSKPSSSRAAPAPPESSGSSSQPSVADAHSATRPATSGRTAPLSQRPAKSARPHSGRSFGSTSRTDDGATRSALPSSSSATTRRASPAAAARRPRAQPLPPRGPPLSPGPLAAGSNRAHTARSTSRRLHPTLAGKRPLSDLVAERVKLSFRLERGVGLPPMRPREVRI